MNKIVTYIILLTFSISINLTAQDGETLGSTAPRFRAKPETQKVDSTQWRKESSFVWKIAPRLGDRILVVEDTARINFHQSSLVDGKDIAVGYLGNIGSPAQTKIFFDRPETPHFIFAEAFSYWGYNPEKHHFRNTKIPYSNIYYQKGGGGERNEERFMFEVSSNFGKNINAGLNVDYLYARGFYANQSNKQFNYDFYGSYTGNKYQMHFFAANNYFLNSENGGITDSEYITNPKSETLRDQGFRGNSMDIPVFINNGWLRSRLRGRHIYLTNKYDIGNDMEEYVVNDSITKWRKKENYISPASVILTSYYKDNQRRIYGSNDYIGLDSLMSRYITFNPDGSRNNASKNPKYDGLMNDLMAYWSFKNTLALSMNEGFKSWTKFGLTAFVEYDMHKYSIPWIIPGVNDFERENSLIIGGVLSKEKGKYLKYKAEAEKDLLNSDLRLEGEIISQLTFKEKEIYTKARGYIKNIEPTFFQQNFSTKYWNWKNDFNDTRRVFIGGEVEIPFTKTKISGGVENLQNFIYSGKDSLMHQESANVQIVSFKLDQKLKAGILNWDNQIAYQLTSNDEVIPLPSLSLYSNLYITSNISKVLTFQLGVDAHIHTKYYMPGYEPLTSQFYNQRDEKIGNFPISTIYLNAHMKNTRFYIMMYNVANTLGNSEYFALYRYPVGPRMIKMGISWNFFN